MVYIDHIFSDFRHIIDELEVKSTTEDREAGHEINTLLAQCLGKKHIFAGVVDRHDDVRLCRLDTERDVVEVPGRICVLDGIHNRQATLGKCRCQQLCRTGTEFGLLMDDDNGLRRGTGGGVDLTQISRRVAGNPAVAVSHAEHVGKASADELVRHTDID